MLNAINSGCAHKNIFCYKLRRQQSTKSPKCGPLQPNLRTSIVGSVFMRRVYIRDALFEFMKVLCLNVENCRKFDTDFQTGSSDIRKFSIINQGMHSCHLVGVHIKFLFGEILQLMEYLCHRVLEEFRLNEYINK